MYITNFSHQDININILSFQYKMQIDNQDIEAQVKQKITIMIDRVHRMLVDKLVQAGKNKNLNQRSLTVHQSDILNLIQHKNQYLYNTLNGLLLIQMILNELFQDDIQNSVAKGQKVILHCYQNMTHLLQNFMLMAKVIKQKDKTLLCRAFSYSNEHLNSILGSLHSFPVSENNQNKKQAFIDRHRSILQQQKFTEQQWQKDKQEQKQQQREQQQSEISSKFALLQEENQQLLQTNEILRQNLSNAQNEIIQLQLKLVNSLKKNEQQQGSRSGNDQDLKQQIVRLRIQIDRMNQQFRIQINKYNQVFRSYQNQINQLKNKNPHLNQNQQIIQQLQTQIVRLRQQIDSDRIIIRQLRQNQYSNLRQSKLSNPQDSRYYSPRVPYNNNNYSRYRLYN